jgi:hypothetical protein
MTIRSSIKSVQSNIIIQKIVKVIKFLTGERMTSIYAGE